MPPQATTSCGRPEVSFVRVYKSGNSCRLRPRKTPGTARRPSAPRRRSPRAARPRPRRAARSPAGRQIGARASLISKTAPRAPAFCLVGPTPPVAAPGSAETAVADALAALDRAFAATETAAGVPGADDAAVAAPGSRDGRSGWCYRTRPDLAAWVHAVNVGVRRAEEAAREAESSGNGYGALVLAYGRAWTRSQRLRTVSAPADPGTVP